MFLRDLTVPGQALPDFVPPPRFGATHFSSYQPQHPSQQVALEKTRKFVREIPASKKTSFSWQSVFFGQKEPQGEGLYLDGGFGVGKTHLLASAYDEFKGKKLYLSFSELVYAMGMLGKAKALEYLGHHQLYCIDEFELDDPGNTLIVKTFLSHVLEKGAFVLTTSNTPPEAQGQGRFNARDFKREIQSIAERFEVIGIEGPDYRKRDYKAKMLTQGELEHLFQVEHTPKPKVRTSWQDLFKVLAEHHPIRYAGLLKQIGTLYIEHAATIPGQNEALRFVHFIDKLYDLKVGLRMSGIELTEVFDVTYRNNAYAKKHYRCLSRIAELLEENRVLKDSLQPTPTP